MRPGDRWWSQSDAERLRDLRTEGKSAEEIAAQLERTVVSVRQKARRMGLPRLTGGGRVMKSHDWGCTCRVRPARHWSRRQLDVLAKMYAEHATIEEIARMIGRSPSSVRVKVARFSLERGGLTQSAVTQIVGGYNWNQVRRWSETGLLHGERLERGGRRAGRGRFGEVRYAHAEVERFLRQCGHLVDRRKVDPAWRQFCEQWITLPEAFERGAPHSATLLYWCRSGYLESRRRGVRYVIREALLPALIEKRREMGIDGKAHLAQVARHRGHERRNLIRRRRGYAVRRESRRASMIAREIPAAEGRDLAATP